MAELEIEVKEEPKPVAGVVPKVELKVEPEAKPTLEVKPEIEVKPAAELEVKPQPTEDWRDKRIPQLVAQKRELETKVAALELQLKQGAGEPDAQFEARVSEEAGKRAQELAGLQKFQSDCLAASEKGKEQFPDFEQKIGLLAKLVDRSDPQSLARYQLFVAAALETGEAPRLLHSLGGDLNEAERIMSLAPLKQGIELAKLALKPQAAPISQLAKPITPIGNRGATHTDIDPSDAERGVKLDIKTWMERRNAQAVEESKRHRGY